MITSPTGPAEVNKSDDRNEDSRTTSGKRFNFSFSEGLLLAIGSSSAYLLTFQYEKGFASHFGIPPQFVSVGLLNVLFGAVLLLGFIFLLVSVVNLFVSFIPIRYSEEPVFVRRAVNLGITLLGVFILAYLYNTRLWWSIFVLGSVLLIFAAFVLPIFRNKNESTYIKKLEAEAKKEQGTMYPSIFNWAARRLGSNLPFVFWYSLMSVFIAATAGDMAAGTQKEFLVATLAPSNEVVLLRRYNDELIFAPFDRRTSEVQKRFIIVKVADLKVPLTLDEVGPLKPVNSPPESRTPVPLEQQQNTPTPSQ
jgi:hypothetical protein